jgi:hypothetical protein
MVATGETIITNSVTTRMALAIIQLPFLFPILWPVRFCPGRTVSTYPGIEPIKQCLAFTSGADVPVSLCFPKIRSRRIGLSYIVFMSISRCCVG